MSGHEQTHDSIFERTQRVNEILAILALQCNDFSASAADIRVDIERFPQMVDRRRTWHGAYIEQHAYVGFQDRAERVEEPPVRIDLLLVLLLETEDDLHGHHALLCALDLHRR